MDYIADSLIWHYAKLFDVKRMEWFSTKEIATVLQIIEENVKIRLFRAKIKLKKISGNNKNW